MVNLMSYLRNLIVAVFSLVMVDAAGAQVIGTVNFDFDSSALDAEALAHIAEIAEELKTIDSYKPTAVVGYTDAVGTNGYNLGLGQRRANAVAAELVRLGVQVDRIGQVESRGEADLLISVSTPERANRRVNVTLDQMLAACRSFRQIAITRQSIGEELQGDLRNYLATARSQFTAFQSNGQNTPAFEVAGAAREACEIAVAYDMQAIRKVEYAKRCLCNSARLQVAMGQIPAQ